MKKLILLIVLCILAVGIAASANIRPLYTANDEYNSPQVLNAITTDPENSEQTTEPATVGILLGVGFVGLVTFSRRG